MQRVAAGRASMLRELDGLAARGHAMLQDSWTSVVTQVRAAADSASGGGGSGDGDGSGGAGVEAASETPTLRGGNEAEASTGTPTKTTTAHPLHPVLGIAAPWEPSARTALSHGVARTVHKSVKELEEALKRAQEAGEEHILQRQFGALNADAIWSHVGRLGTRRADDAAAAVEALHVRSGGLIGSTVLSAYRQFSRQKHERKAETDQGGGESGVEQDSGQAGGASTAEAGARSHTEDLS